MSRRVFTHQIRRERASRTGEILVVPHRRAASGLEGRAVTLEDLAIIQLREAGEEIASRLTRKRLLRDGVQSVCPELPPDEAGELVLQLSKSVETLLRTGIGPEELTDDPEERIRMLAQVTGIYRERLRAGSLVDSGELFWRAAAVSEANGQARSTLVVRGFFRLRRDEIGLLDRLAGDGSEIILPGGSEPILESTRKAIDQLSRLGWEIVQACDKSPVVSGWERACRIVAGGAAGDGVTAFTASTVDTEVRETLRRIGRLAASGVGLGEMVILTTDMATYGPALQAIGREYGIAVSLPEEEPPGSSRFRSWVRLMVEMIGSGFSYEPALAFLNHTLSGGLPKEQLNVVFAHRPDNLASWRNCLAAPGTPWPTWLGDADEPVEMARRDWVAILVAAVDQIRPRLDSTGLALSERVRLALDDQVWLSGEESIAGRLFASEVVELLATVRVAPPETTPGLELLEPEMIAGSEYQHIFVVGMVEGSLPRPISDGEILDLYERRRLFSAGYPIETADSLVRDEQLTILSALAAATGSLTFSMPRMKDHEVTIPTALFSKIANHNFERIELHSGSDAATISLEERRRADPERTRPDDQLSGHIRRALSIERWRELAAFQDEYDGITGRGLDARARVWSASQLTSFGQCRFQWFSRYILGIEDDGEQPAELTARQYGQLLHRTLELALEGLPDETSPGEVREWALSRLAESLDAAADDPDNPLCKFPAWPAQRNQILNRLQEAIRSEHFLAKEATVIGNEVRFDALWRGLRVTGWIDRLDRTPQGIEMIDYKSGRYFPRGANDGSGRLKLDLQLPIYIEAAGQQLFPGQRVTGRYYSLSTRKNLVRRQTDQSERLDGFVGSVRQKLAEGDFAVAPDVAGQACEYCELEMVCRRGQRLGRKTGFDSVHEEEEKE